MMLKEKSSPWARLKYLYVLPLAAIAVTAFARPEISNKMEEISAVKVNDLAAIVETKVQETVPKVVKDTLKTVGKVVKVVGWKASTDSLETVQVKPGDGLIGGSVNFHRLSSSQSTGNPLVIIDGKEIDYSLLNAIRPDRIESISVLKDDTATKIYGDKGKNGVILISVLTEEEFKENQRRQNSDEQASDRVKISSMKTIAEQDGMDSKKVTYFVDGQKVAPEAVKQLEDDNAFTISRVSVSKSKDGNNGFIHIITKKGSTTKVGDNELKVVGKVMDENGDAIGGAAVLIKGTNQGTIADADGYFRMVTPKDAILSISYIGLQSTEVKVSSNPFIVTLKEE